MVSGREDLSLHSVGSIQAVNDYPNYTWDGLILNLFCSITFIVNVTHKQQHHFTFQLILATGNHLTFQIKRGSSMFGIQVQPLIEPIT